LPDGLPLTPDRAVERRQILDAAALVFDEIGYHHASIAQLAEKAGTTKATVYDFFEAKHDILFAIHDEWIEDLLARSRRNLATTSDTCELVRHFARDVLTIIHERQSQVRIYFEYLNEMPPVLQARARGKRDVYEKLVEDVIRAGMAAGLFKDQSARVATLGFFGMCNWAHRWYKPGGAITHEQIADQLSDIFLCGLQIRPEPAKETL
jgi:AcrR family transcriptional regulator